MDGRSLLGTVLSLIFIFLTLQAPRGGISLGWWGNTVHMKSMPRFFLIDLFVVTDLVFFFLSGGLVSDTLEIDTGGWDS